MIIKNANICDENFNIVRKDIKIEDEKISDIGLFEEKDNVMDFSECTVLPGFIDIHIHGCKMADASDQSTASINIISEHLAKMGVTSFCPTTMTLPPNELEDIFLSIRKYMGNETGAYIHGVNMEGPYISHAKKGAQKESDIRVADIDEFYRLNQICKISIVDVAPEFEENLNFIKESSKVCVVSAAHTNATYEQALEGFKSGISHATHLFNAMSGISAREPGVAGAVLESQNITAELICDGFHLAPATIRLAFKLLGEDRTIVVSDSMKAAGCDDGEYELGGQTVYVKDGKALLADGTIAASTTNIYQEFLNLLSFGIDFRHAIKSCTINPAKAIGADDLTGSIAKGKFADLVVLDSENEIKAVLIKGKLILKG